MKFYLIVMIFFSALWVISTTHRNTPYTYTVTASSKFVGTLIHIALIAWAIILLARLS